MQPRTRLVKRALAAGLGVFEDQDGYARITAGNASVIQWPNGALTRGDVRLDLTKRMTFAEALRVLKLEDRP